MTPTLFLKDATGFVIPEVNPDSAWVFEQMSVIVREYKGIEILLDYNGWQFHAQGQWTQIYPKVNWFKFQWQRLFGTIELPESPFAYTEELDSASLLLAETYEHGLYWLLSDEDNNWFLIPQAKSEQMGHIQMANIHELDPMDAYVVLRNTMEPMRDSVYGIIFMNPDGRQARLRTADFDWSEDE